MVNICNLSPNVDEENVEERADGRNNPHGANVIAKESYFRKDNNESPEGLLTPLPSDSFVRREETKTGRNLEVATSIQEMDRKLRMREASPHNRFALPKQSCLRKSKSRARSTRRARTDMYIPGGAKVEDPPIPKSTSQRRGVRFGDESDHEIENGFGMIPRAQEVRKEIEMTAQGSPTINRVFAQPQLEEEEVERVNQPRPGGIIKKNPKQLAPPINEMR